MAISQIFILTPRGDTVVSRDYRGDCPRGTADIFFRKLTSLGDEAPPIFSIQKINFIHIKRNSLYFVCTTKFNTSPAMLIELLVRISELCKDYCGILSVESVRQNFVLIYEIMDEAIDFGYGQDTATEQIRTYVHNEAVAVESQENEGIKFKRLSQGGAGKPAKKSTFGKRKQKKLESSSARNKPLGGGGKASGKNEIFVDLLEQLTVLFDARGNVQRMEIDGQIQMKSYLQGLPELSVGLNEDLSVGRDRGGPSYGITVDDCNFHESVQLHDDNVLVLRPPEGEFTLMNYRISGITHHPLPFKCSIECESAGGALGKTDVIVKLDCDFPSTVTGATVSVKVPLPKSTSSCSYELGALGQTVKYDKDDKVAVWKLSKIKGGLAYYCKLKLMNPEAESRNVPNEIGPVRLDFEVPTYVCSGINIRFLQVQERGKNYVPHRWVRNITYSDSYIFRR